MPDRQFSSVDSNPGHAYLSPNGPHQCDICGDVVATLKALWKDCSDHGREREHVVDGSQTVEPPTDLDVLVADVREIAKQMGRHTGRDPFELQIVAARALLQSSREETDSDGTRAAIGYALDWTAPSELTGGRDA